MPDDPRPVHPDAATRADLQSLLDNSPAVIYMKNLQGRFMFVNRLFERLFQLTREEALGHTDYDYFPKELADVYRVNDAKVLASRGPLELEEDALQEDGAHTYISLKFPLLGADGAPYAVAGISTDISERKLLERELLGKNQELELQGRRVQEANRLKSEFLANMSHELRTPLNAIIGFVQLMYDGHVLPGSNEYREFLTYVLSSSRHLLQLINDVLDLSKVEAGKMEFRPEPLDPSEVVREVCEVLRPVSSKKGIRVATTVDPGVGILVLDPAKLKQILYNLLSNALKFTPEGGNVSVRLLLDGPAFFLLQVEDTGIGIKPEDVGRLFVEFQQLDQGPAKKQQGTGLGLALTKKIVEALGGTVDVRSVQGRGSIFTARLARVPGDRRDLGPSKGVQAILPAGVGARSVLVIEDDPNDRAVLVQLLTEAGYAVQVALTGAEAVKRVRATAFDAITLDLLLPDRAGWDILRTIRTEGLNRETPVVVLTLAAEKGVGAAFPVQDILTKPVVGEELLLCLTRAGIPPDGTRAVLVVEDDPKALKLIEVTLKRLGYRPVCRSDGESGLQAAGETAPDVVVLDLMLPGMNGFEFLQRFRALPSGRRTPVIIWTNKDLSAEESAQLRPMAQVVVSKGQGGISPLVAELEACLLAFRTPEERSGIGLLP